MSIPWEVLSEASSHTDHVCRLFGQSGCRGCRWFETRLERYGDEYRVTMIGKSVVPGEVDRVRVERTTSAEAVVDYLALGEPGRRYIPKVSRKVLHEASSVDENIAGALHYFDAVVP